MSRGDETRAPLRPGVLPHIAFGERLCFRKVAERRLSLSPRRAPARFAEGDAGEARCEATRGPARPHQTDTPASAGEARRGTELERIRNAPTPAHGCRMRSSVLSQKFS
jgi:hypothetical protein